MSPTKTLELPPEVSRVLQAVKKLRARYATYSSLRFTPDGHLVGDLGVAVAADAFGLQPTKASTASCDAMAGGKRVEIKATAREPAKAQFSFAKVEKGTPDPHRVIALRFDLEKCEAELVYDGPYAPIRALIVAKSQARVANGKSAWPKNGQLSITRKQMQGLAAS